MRLPVFFACFAVGLGALLTPTLSWAGPIAPKCLWAIGMGQVKCAPPFGDIIQDVNTGKFLCGVGQCVINPAGMIRCSSVVGGAAVIDSRNRAACVGGCRAPEESLCVIPRP